MAGPRQGIVHLYTPRLTAFEHTPHPSQTPPRNLLLFLGGLFDGLCTVPYVSILSTQLPPTWSLAEIHLSSSYTGWGTSSLTHDVIEIAQCITYFRSIKSGKIILMGNSTGCQDIMHYLTSPSHQKRPGIDGAIIQAAVSDREAIMMTMDPDLYKSSCKTAQSMVSNCLGGEILPSSATNNFFPCPVSASRWLSLASPNHDGEDDYFSSDLPETRLANKFGKLPKETPLCVLLSGEDEYTPASVDKAELLKRWVEITKKGEGKIDEVNSGIVKGATHNLAEAEEGVVKGLVERVLGFLDGLKSQANS